MRRFQNVSAVAQPLPDSTLRPAEIVEFDRVPHEVTGLVASGALVELADEPAKEPAAEPTEAPSTSSRNKK